MENLIKFTCLFFIVFSVIHIRTDLIDVKNILQNQITNEEAKDE